MVVPMWNCIVRCDMSDLVSQIETFVHQSLPAAALDQAVLAALVALIAGIGLCVLGAKLARFALTCACITGGGYLGMALIAPDMGLPSAACAVGGAVVVGAIGFLSFRLWVGLMAASLASALVLGAFSYQRVLPYLDDFNIGGEAMALSSPAEYAQDFKLAAAERIVEAKASTREALAEYWDFVKARDMKVVPHARSLGLGAALLGLFVGIVAMRFALILSTSFLGTMLVGSGVTGLLSGFSPGFYKAVAQHQSFATAALGMCFVISLILQARLTRKPSTAPAKSSDKA